MWSSVCLALAAAVCAAGDAPDGFTEAIVGRSCGEVTPAIGMLSFTAEVTDPASGMIAKQNRSALGLVVTPDGLVMANGHMFVENSVPTNIVFTAGQGDNEKEYPAKLLKKPDDLNVCFLQIESETPLKLPAVHFSPEADLKLGSPIMVIGLYSRTLDYTRGVAFYHVGAILDKPRKTYCLDQPVRFGFVTSPVIDARGRVVGVIGFDLDISEGGELYVRSGHPLIYQTALFEKYIQHPPSESDIIQAKDSAWLGVFSQPLKDDFAEYWGLEKAGGVIVSTVVTDSPAAKAGIQSGDIITSFNGVPVRPRQDREIAQFTKLVRETGVGQTVKVNLLRNGQPIEVEVTLDARPKPAREAEEYVDETFGLTVRELTTDVRLMLNLPDTAQGVIIRRVKSGSVAQAAGMRPGLIIMNFGDQPVTNLDDFEAAVKAVAADKPKEIPVFCRAGSATGFLRLEPRWDDGGK